MGRPQRPGHSGRANGVATRCLTLRLRLYLLRGVDSIGGFPTLLYPKRGMAMSKIFRLGAVLTLAGLVFLASNSRLARAQRFNFGNQNNNNSNRDDDDRDEDKDEDENKNQNQQSNRSSRNRTNEQVQQFLQGRQGGQNNQNQGQQGQPGNVQQLRRNQPNQFQDGQFQNGQFQGGQFQQFRPQEGQQQLRFGNWQGNQWQGSRKVDNWANVFGSGNRPFSREWYEEHPKAWRHDEHDHDHDDVWVVASLPGVYTWLGWGDVPGQGGIRVGTQPRVDLSRFHNFYPLGVYSLMSGPGDMGTRIVQLSIDRHGHISGNYYDMITDTNSSVSGEVRRDSQRVSWSVNKNRSIRFRASLNRLLQPYGTVVVQMPGGEQDWQFVRLEN